ncbi:MAG: chromosomal replication initiator protein DnaA [Planctomycetes bacterium]|nr:chromosomal replication initiator protein DnaA [Planctomycetota bacterium]
MSKDQIDRQQLKVDLLGRLHLDHATMCRRWFDDIVVLGIVGGTLLIQIQEPVQLKYLQRCCTQQFAEAAQSITGHLLGVRFVGEEGITPSTGNVAGSGRFGKSGVVSGDNPRGTSVLSSFDIEEDLLISPDYNFENFVVGPGNRLAHAAATAVSTKPGQAYNPLFIHGGVGLGKTHLLQSICQTAIRKHASMRIYYVSCNGFMTQFLEGVQEGKMSSFRNKFRAFDMLVIDDIHDLSKRDQTQEEFFHTFNTLFQSGKQLVLSSDAPPSEIPYLEERLISRFSCGLVASIDPPGFETRVAIIKKKAVMRNIDIPDDVTTYVASHLDSNIRLLEGAITTLQSVAMLDGEDISLELAKRTIGNENKSDVPTNISIQNILDSVTVFYNIKLSDLLSKRRHKSITVPRQVGMWLSRKHTRFSLEEIGGYFGGRDHTTVMHAIKTINKKIEDDEIFQREISLLGEQLSDKLGV